MSDARWRAGFANSLPRGLRFDLQAPWASSDERHSSSDFPAQHILNHTGLPSDRRPRRDCG